MSTARIKRLAETAIEAIDQYNKEVAAGGEPIYPQWARDLSEVLDAHALMTTALKAVQHEMMGTDPNTASSYLPHRVRAGVDAALVAAGAQ